MEDIYSFPKREIAFYFKCIEGWSQISYRGGVNFSDYNAKNHLGTHSGKAYDLNDLEDLFKYVGLMTPDSAYYVCIDINSMLQSQAILSYELNEKSLPRD